MTLQIRLFSISCSFIIKNYKDVLQVGVIDKSEIDLRGYVDQGSTGETVHNTRHRHLPSGGRSTAESYTFIYRTYNTVDGHVTRLTPKIIFRMIESITYYMLCSNYAYDFLHI